MRAIYFLLLLLPATEMLGAQGTVIPRPCVVRPCMPGRPCPPCGTTGPVVTKQSSVVRAELTDRVLRYEVTETFVNRGSGIGEADYIFPLPKGAAFQDLKLSINGEMVSGETMNAAEARAIYEQIVRQQRDPALVEWMGHGLLRARIFPIAPGEEKKVIVRFQMVAEREGDALRVDYFQGKRSQAAGIAGPEDGRDESSRGSFTLTYDASDTYGRAYSPTHAITITRGGGRREARVTGNAGEITLLIPVRRSSEPSISVLAHAVRGDEGFALITLTPPVVAQQVTPRDVTLVLDVSGSMSGIKIRQARAAGLQLLATLNPLDRFRLIDFSTEVRSFREGFVRATPANIRDGSRYLESLDASGSTNISGALDAALDGEPSSGRLGVVLFVTDGEATVGERNPDAIASRVAHLRRDRRIFSFGVGADVNAALIERLALEGRGTAHFVRPEESVERSVSVVASRLGKPVVTDVRVSAQGVNILKLHPSEATDIFAGQDYVLLARYSGSGTSTLTFDGQTANGPVRWISRVTFPAAQRENSFVARLWATQRVGYLTAEKRQNGRSREVDDEIRQLGEKYAIPTEFTSYLVLEPGMEAALRGRVSGGTANGNVVVRGAAGSVAAPPPVSAQSARFEAARDASKQRSATNLAVADEVDARGSAGAVRRVGQRSFLLNGEKWIDSRRGDAGNLIKVRAFSDAWFKLVEVIPELREVFALGDRVFVRGRAVAIETGLDGRESLSDSELRTIQADW